MPEEDYLLCAHLYCYTCLIPRKIVIAILLVINHIGTVCVTVKW
jgi:hypothetical protein